MELSEFAKYIIFFIGLVVAMGMGKAVIDLLLALRDPHRHK